MKKVFTVIILLFAMVFIQNADAQKVINSEGDEGLQTKKQRIMETYEYGAKIGMNYAKVSSKSSTNQKARIGLTIGAFGVYNLDRDFALQAEALYSMKGFEENQINSEYYFNLDYLDIPILFKYKFRLSKGLYSSAYAGPNFSFLISSKETEKTEWASNEKDISDIKGFDFGISIGFDITTYISGAGRFIFDFRYYGLDFIKMSEVSSSHKLYEEGTHRVLSLTAGYYF